MKKAYQISELIGLFGTILTMIICGKILKTDMLRTALIELPFAVCLVISAVLNEKLPEKERDSGRYSLITGVHHPIYLAALVMTSDLMLIAGHFWKEKAWIGIIAIAVVISAEICVVIKIRKANKQNKKGTRK